MTGREIFNPSTVFQRVFLRDRFHYSRYHRISDLYPELENNQASTDSLVQQPTTLLKKRFLVPELTTLGYKCCRSNLIWFTSSSFPDPSFFQICSVPRAVGRNRHRLGSLLLWRVNLTSLIFHPPVYQSLNRKHTKTSVLLHILPALSCSRQPMPTSPLM